MPSTQTEVKFLRAEVRALRQRVAQLESELACSQADEDEEFQALWPYRWIVGGIDKTRHCLHSFQLRAMREGVPRENAPRRAQRRALKCAERSLGTF